MIKVKICGVTNDEILMAAHEAGADWIGLVHFPPSPRHVEMEKAVDLAERCRALAGAPETVLLLVDPDNETVTRLSRAVRPDWIQLHGKESPERVRQVRDAAGGARIMKAVAASDFDELERCVIAYGAVADMMLFDAVPAAGAMPGGEGRAFDWHMLRETPKPPLWALAGGLTPENVRTAIARTGAPAVDVSSGVESARGIKDPDKILRFVAEAKRSV